MEDRKCLIVLKRWCENCKVFHSEKVEFVISATNLEEFIFLFKIMQEVLITENKQLN